MKNRKALVQYHRTRKAKKRKAKSNPQIVKDFTDEIIPGFVAYAATRFLARIVHKLAAKKWPKGGKHLAVGSTVVAGLAVYYGTDKLESTQKYHSAATVGASIAALQTVAQGYLPKYGWMMGDLETKPAPVATTTALPEGMSPIDSPTRSFREVDEADDEIDKYLGTGDLGSLASGPMGSLSDSDLDALEADFG